MAEQLIIRGEKREEIYASLFSQISSLVQGETNRIANLANVSAALKETFGFLWVGFYLVEGDELVLGPFQGPLACTRIRKGKGVCGAAWEERDMLSIPDVNDFPGHIACSSLSRSELVVPLIHQGEVWGVLDVDSEHVYYFNETDEYWLERLCKEVLSAL